MSFNIHLADFFILHHPDLCSQYILNRFGPGCNAGHPELKLTSLRIIGPVVASGEPLCEWLSNVRGILALLDVIELIGESLQILSFDNVGDVL